MSDISLSKAVRSNLLSLQNTASMMEKTQNRLATGNKVNSALDNPTNFFTASALNSRAGDLGSLMDSMANGIQTLEAADNGLSAITKTLESMQSILRQARQDKSFLTDSYEISPGATGNIGFIGGSVGATTRYVPVQNTALTNTALGMNAASTNTPGVAPTALAQGYSEFTLNATPGDLAGSDTITLDVTIDGTTTPVIIDAVDIASVGGGGSNVTAGKLRTILQNELGSGVTIGGTGDTIRITSNNAAGGGGDSTIAISAATVGNADAGTTVTDASLGLGTAPTATAGSGTAAAAGTALLTWPGTPIEVNNDARITFTVSVDGQPQKVEITRKDVMKVGNGDATISSADEFAAILASKIDGVSAAASGDAITITSDTTGAASNVAVGIATVTGINYDSDELVRLINTNPHLKDRIRASNDDGKLRIENQSTQELEVHGVNSAGTIVGGTTTGEKISGNTVRADLAKQFNEQRDQLDKLSDDASFNGINLLRGDLLTILFNETGTSSIDVQTKDTLALNSAKLNLFDLDAKELDLDMDIDELLATVKNALSHVRTQASTFGQNLSMVENRQAFTKNMINTLETGAANLTLADMNEEAANLLALQTRQQLSSNSLSLASQADQSVLQLLR